MVAGAPRVLLGIETSCDETAAAVVTESLDVLADVVTSSIALHERFGGVVPELAGRAQVDAIGPVVAEALAAAGRSPIAPGIDGVAVTVGPGLVGSLLVGVTFAKALALAWDVPLIGVNHLEGHLVAAHLEHRGLEHPVLTLLVSGGHTLLVLERAPRCFELLGATIDDAVGRPTTRWRASWASGTPAGPSSTGWPPRGTPGPSRSRGPCATRGSTSASRG